MKNEPAPARSLTSILVVPLLYAVLLPAFGAVAGESQPAAAGGQATAAGESPGAAPTAGVGPAAAWRIEGRVVTTSGSPIAGARVSVEAGGRRSEATTGSGGRFALDAPGPGELTLTVEAAGFLRVSRRLNAAGEAAGTEQKEKTGLVIVLSPALSERVATTAARIPMVLPETASSVTVLSAEDLAAAGAARLDDVLRQVPGFTLFRRSGSRTANPTSQGVSLRGIGASGASRALVIDDGVPLNDPFGGWVYWGRLPRMEIDSVEVLRGGASDLYGGAALAGVVNLERRQVGRPTLSAEAFYGSEATTGASLYAAGLRGGWGGAAAAELFRTDGYIPVAGEERGEVDTPAGSKDAAVELSGERHLTERDRLFLRGWWFDESRENGTRLQKNDTNIKQAAAGWDRRMDQGSLSLRFYASRQDYTQSFSAVSAPGRDTERLTRLQEVPSRAAGLGFEWNRELGAANRIVAGTDIRTVRGTSHEEIAATGSLQSAGGRQWIAGLFAEDIARLGTRCILTAGARWDRWRNGDANRTSNGSTTFLEDRSEGSVSPRVSLLVKAMGGLSFSASAYRSFRPPTLNELYRSFRVGSILTQANDQLRAETLKGAESGLRWDAASSRFFLRGDMFWMEVTDPIANVTISGTPGLITRQRENLGSLRSRGIELEADAHLGGGWKLSGGYMLADSVVTSFPANPSIEGRRVPQVPRHQITTQLRYSSASLGTFGAQARWNGGQFDDDRNQLRLDGFFVLDALWSGSLAGGVSLFVAGENLSDTRYAIGRTPVATLGAPRTMRAGLRFTIGP
ncbi:MAG: hypothetical protein DMF49_07120 [Acidobacteria bacterium]|nr:MAG: hypothetical protein DMF49_07120 [Acidobacteriota bacterium]